MLGYVQQDTELALAWGDGEGREESLLRRSSEHLAGDSNSFQVDIWDIGEDLEEELGGKCC